ncbi:MAG: outer membrane beta-barrel protein, partial [Flavobacteriales bacterium]|nr:outer membrane beta-barrel protein [Flavobacteriales bacterium]
NSFRFLPSMDLQLTVDVRGPMTFAQGRMAEMWGIDLGYRYDFLKGKASITLNLTDIFNTRRFYVDSRGDNFTGTVLRKRETRVATIQFTYRFGKQQQGQQPTRRRPIDGGSDDMDI